MNRQQKSESEEFKILEEEGYDLEQFLCRCPGKTKFKTLEASKEGIEKDISKKEEK